MLDGVEEKDSKLQYYRKVYIYGANIQREAIKEIYESKLGGYKGIAKTIAQVRKYYNFLYILAQVKEVVKKCNIYNRSKTGRYKLYRLLQPLPIAQRPWSSITIDFITKLPTSKDSATSVIYDSIFIVVDWLIKWVYFFLYKEIQTVEQLVDIVYRNVASVHVQLEEWITDHDTKFASKFQQVLIKRLDVNSKLSIVYHLQIDSQTERLNQVIEQYLRSYINYQQDNQVILLPATQLTYNTTPTKIIKVILFFANFRYKADLRQGLEVIVPHTAVKADQMHILHEMLWKELEFVVERIKEYYDRYQLEGPRLKRGDKVYLLVRNLYIKRPSEKLDFKKLGPFVIEEKISTSNYRLSLLDTIKVRTNVFHISLLELAPPNARLAI